MAATINLSPPEIQKACQYLLFTKLRIKKIGDKIGIVDSYYFSRVFTKVMGMPPKTIKTKGISEFSLARQ